MQDGFFIKTIYKFHTWRYDKEFYNQYRGVNLDELELNEETTVIEPKHKKNIVIGFVLSIFGSIFVIFSLGEFVLHEYIAGLLFLLAAIIAISPTAGMIEKKLNISLPSIAQVFIVFLLVVLAFSAMPNTDTRDQNTSAVAAPPSTLSMESSESTTTSNSDGLVPVVATNYSCHNWGGWYPTVTLFGEKYVLIKTDDASKIAKLILDTKDRYTLKTGDKVDLGQGYALEAKQVDVDGNKVWFEFTKDGEFVDDQILCADNDSYNSWSIALDDIQGEDDVVVCKVRLNQTFQGAVDSIGMVDGLWLIDYANAKTLKIGDKLGHFKLVKINSATDESNLGSLIFEPDGTQNNIQTATPDVTPTPEASGYQDKDWANSCSNQMILLQDDMNNVGEAATNLNSGDLQKYGTALTTDSKNALDESQSYSVSPNLQPAKEKYETALYDFNQAGYYTTLGSTQFKNGNSEQASQNFETATTYTNWGNTNLKEAKSLLDDYNLKQ